MALSYDDFRHAVQCIATVTSIAATAINATGTTNATAYGATLPIMATLPLVATLPLLRPPGAGAKGLLLFLLPRLAHSGEALVLDSAFN